MLIVIKYHQNI